VPDVIILFARHRCTLASGKSAEWIGDYRQGIIINLDSIDTVGGDISVANAAATSCA
jgi:hypothetical protein